MELPTGRVVQRVTQRGVELLMQRGYLKGKDGDGRQRKAAFLVDRDFLTVARARDIMWLLLASSWHRCDLGSAEASSSRSIASIERSSLRQPA